MKLYLEMLNNYDNLYTENNKDKILIIKKNTFAFHSLYFIKTHKSYD